MYIVVGHQFNSSPIVHSRISVGDVMFLVSNMYTAMYTFELCYRTGISPIAWLHHTGTAIMAQYALILSGDPRHKDGPIEQILCLIWGKSASILPLPSFPSPPPPPPAINTPAHITTKTTERK